MKRGEKIKKKRNENKFCIAINTIPTKPKAIISALRISIK